MMLISHEVGWKNATHRHQWRMTLSEYCKPIANLPVKDIDTDLVLKVLTPAVDYEDRDRQATGVGSSEC